MQNDYASAMRRTFDLARRGPEFDVNPRVGCVILDNSGRIVSEGWHRGAGTAHAETDAIAHLPPKFRDPEAAKKLTAVVTLEPCNHTGRTGPCSIALIDAGIGRVVFALADTGLVSGGGSTRLREAGVEVISGLLEAEARVLLASWLAANQQYSQKNTSSRPRIIAKWAQTLDGRAAANDGSSKWISGAESRAHVHAERALADAILVGTGTILADDPTLTARTPSGELLVPAELQPIPVIFGSREVRATAVIHNHPALQANGLDAPPHIRPSHIDSDLAQLVKRGIASIYIEGGPQTIRWFLKAGLVDELHVYVAPKLLGGQMLAIGDLGIDTIDAALTFTEVSYVRLGNDVLIIAKLNNKEGESNVHGSH